MIAVFTIHMMTQIQIRMNKTVSEWKKNWMYFLCLYLENNYDKIKSANVIDDCHIMLNDDEFKVDVNEYTGSEENYIFFNASSGRICIQRKDRLVVDRLEVSLA
jgi:hypothetical protein